MDDDEGVDPASSLSSRKKARNMLIPTTTHTHTIDADVSRGTQGGSKMQARPLPDYKQIVFYRIISCQ